MAIIFSHDTALEILRAIPPQAKLTKPFAGEVPMGGDGITTDFGELARVDPAAFGARSRPVHVLVGKGQRRSQAREVISHEFGEGRVPFPLLWGFSQASGSSRHGIYFCSPEAVFVQLSRTADLVSAVCLGFELCGAYSHFAPPVSGFYERPPLTTGDRIFMGLEWFRGSRGLGRSQEALSLVCEGSRSPMETLVACELAFPDDLGGFGFEKPELNYEVALDAVSAGLAGSRRCYIDIAWPDAKVGIEYNGREYHLDHARDRKRVEALEHMGWSIRTVEARDLADPRRLEAVVRTLRGKVPERNGTVPQRASRTQRAALHAELLGATRSGLGLEAALFAAGVPHGIATLHV